MRLLILAVLLSSAAVAQPSAADSALVDRVVGALGLDQFADPDTVPGAPRGPLDVLEGIRSTFLVDLDPALVTAALVVLEGEAFARVEDARKLWASDQVGLQELQGPQADSSLAADFSSAYLAAMQPPGARLEVVEETRWSLPDSTVAVLEDIGILDELTSESSMVATREREMQTQYAQVLRYQLAAVAPSDLEAVIAYYRSDAGRYVGYQIALGGYRATIPEMLEMVARMATMRRE